MNKRFKQFLNSIIFIISIVLINNSVHADTLTVSIATGNDDVEQFTNNGNMILDDIDLDLGSGRNQRKILGLRFQNVTIPAGATIISAYIELTSLNQSSGLARIDVHGELNTNSLPFTTQNYNLSNRSQSVSTARSFWFINRWGATVYQTGDLGLIIQEMISLNGWASGNPMTFILSGIGWRFQAYSSEGDPIQSARLVIEYGGNPDIVALKTVSVLNDPLNGTTNPKAIPGAEMYYSLSVTNFGTGPADSNSIYTTDQIPVSSALFVGDLSGGGPIVFSDGTDASGLSYTYGGVNDNSDDLEFSNDGGVSFNYTPTPDAFGYDASVTHFRINPKGQFSAALNGATPSYTINFKIRIQ